MILFIAGFLSCMALSVFSVVLWMLLMPPNEPVVISRDDTSGQEQGLRQYKMRIAK